MRHNFALLFENSVVRYLHAIRPEYLKGQFDMVEHELQGFFLARLIQRVDVLAERPYPNSRQRFDLKAGKRDSIYMEIEWDAKLTDCFTKRTFSDLEKLCKLVPVGSRGMFLAVNISDKYTEFPHNAMLCTSPDELPTTRTGRATALRRYWNDATEIAPLMHCNPRFKYWRYPHGKANKPYNVLVFSCIGRRVTKQKWTHLHEPA